MWQKMTEGWIWVVAVMDLALSFGVAQLLVHYGWRYGYMLDQPLDASNSVFGYALMFGVTLPVVAFVVSTIGFTPKTNSR
jgi:hypothetical protein